MNQPVSWNGTVGFLNTIQLCHEGVWIFLQDEPLLVISIHKHGKVTPIIYRATLTPFTSIVGAHFEKKPVPTWICDGKNHININENNISRLVYKSERFSSFFFEGWWWPTLYLVGGWTAHLKKYAKVKLDHFPRDWGKNKEHLNCHHLGMGFRTYPNNAKYTIYLAIYLKDQIFPGKFCIPTTTIPSSFPVKSPSP